MTRVPQSPFIGDTEIEQVFTIVVLNTTGNISSKLYAVGASVAEWSRYRIVAGLVTSSSPVPLKTRCVGENVKSVESSNVLPLV
ncbi:hypothetical protein TNCV_2795421 [Trichonephila clavipes]|nr:hypothetical protein TNCV_2795421 [Trichonephila clavipes]